MVMTIGGVICLVLAVLAPPVLFYLLTLAFLTFLLAHNVLHVRGLG
jgi:hypothetical protein